ncbi:hypothetical protein E2C01_064297 [Portunus trituberculatus]|uniref:Uncharacterized protein n=1 Tax=Portunus trituberculatus TaxID=210409 RepID=A0A5B7HBB4_PORTR|nr:hypothetical protein [Portunus trituberculatus]
MRCSGSFTPVTPSPLCSDDVLSHTLCPSLLLYCDDVLRCTRTLHHHIDVTCCQALHPHTAPPQSDNMF